MIIVATPRFFNLPHYLEGCGGHKGISYPILSDQVKCLFWIEFLGTMSNNWNAMMQTGKEDINEPSDPSPIRRGPKEIILPWKEIMGKFNPRKMP